VRLFSSVPLIAGPFWRKSRTLLPSRDPQTIRLIVEQTNLQPRQCSASGVLLQVFRCAANFCNKWHVRKLQSYKSRVYLSSWTVLWNVCNVLISYCCMLIGQGFICRYLFITMYNFVYQLNMAKFFGVPLLRKGSETLAYTRKLKLSVVGTTT
jgi:hypothetical protein